MNKKLTYLDYLSLFNMDYDEFKERYEGEARIVNKDGEPRMVTSDFHEERLNLVIKENKIIDIYIG